MSAVMIRREVPPVRFYACECGHEFASASCDVQAEFLIAFAQLSESFDWPQQCRMIVDELEYENVQSIKNALDVLVDHLNERMVIRCTDAD